MKLIIFLLLLIPFFGSSQDLKFEVKSPLLVTGHSMNALMGLYEGETVTIDIDNDEDLDILISGENSLGFFTKLYLNDGFGNFEESPTVFESLSEGTIDVAHFNNDLYIDVLLTGTNSLNQRQTKMYKNNGDGTFSTSSNININNFPGISYGDCEFADVDGDNDFDFIMSGFSNSGEITKLYKNNGSGFFSEDMSQTFTGLGHSSVQFLDKDNDGDQDLVLSGNNPSSQNVTLLFENDGLGNFTEIINNQQLMVTGDIEAGDIDGDNDMDIIIVGNNITVYKNDSTGQFTYHENLSGLSSGTAKFFDRDNDGDIDIVACGFDNSSTKRFYMYDNDSTGNFSQISGVDAFGVYRGSICVGDLNNDSHTDIVVAGLGNNGSVTTLYINNGDGSISKSTGSALIGTLNSSVAYGDIDNDDDLDVIVTGLFDGAPKTQLYKNDGEGNYSPLNSSNLIQVRDGSTTFSDVDNDGDLDLLITGATELYPYINQKTKLYKNDGMGIFTEDLSNIFTDVYDSRVEFADIDNDNDSDLLIIGYTTNNISSTKLYNNIGGGTFVENNSNFFNLNNPTSAFGDIDNDNDLDLIIMGASNGGAHSRTYYNDGNGNYSSIGISDFQACNFGAIALADLNSDSYLDIVVTGNNTQTLTYSGLTKIYLNTPNGPDQFVELVNTSLENVYNSCVSLGDVDLDQDVDILISGDNYLGPVSKLYLNDGNANYTEVFADFFMPSTQGDCKIIDIDGDNDLDISIIGYNGIFPTARLYENTLCKPVYAGVAPNSICEVDSALLFLPINYQSYLWSTGETSASIYVSDTNTYKVKATSLNGCQKYSQEIKLKIFDCTELVDSLHTTASTCFFDTLDILNTSANLLNYTADSLYLEWDFQTFNGARYYFNQSYLFSNYGLQQVSITFDCNGSQASYFDYVNIYEDIDTSTAVDSSVALNTIYPNPSNNNSITVDFGEQLIGANISVYNSAGVFIFNVSNINSSPYTLSLQNLNVGIYFVQITNNDFVETLQLVVN